MISEKFHSVANFIAASLMKALFGSVARIHVLRGEHTIPKGGAILAANHISHFDPFIISGIVRRKIDWMAMAEFFRQPILGLLLRAVDAFPAERDRADLRTLRQAISRLKNDRIVGLFPEGGIRHGERSLLEGARLRAGAPSLAQIASVPIVPCVILGSDRLYAARNWWPFRRVSVWIAFGDPVECETGLSKSDARNRIETCLTAQFQKLYRELRETFRLQPDDLPHSPQERMAPAPPFLEPKKTRRRFLLRRVSAFTADSIMCASMNLLQSRHRLNVKSREQMERYVAACEPLTIDEFYSGPANDAIADAIQDTGRTSVTWRCPIQTQFPVNDLARADLFPCRQGWSAPTVLMLHALMSVHDIGYRRCAARFNQLGWNACFVHLPYHYSRVPPGHWNGELAITADLIRNAEALRQGVVELRQLMAALRKHGCPEFGVLGTSYGGWIGALLAAVEPDFRFLALMAPIVNVEHAIWQNRGSAFMRRELRKAKIPESLVARFLPLSSPLHNRPLCHPSRILFVTGDFDTIARSSDIEQLHRQWRGSELLRVPQGHFGYRMLRETMARLETRQLIKMPAQENALH